MKHSGYSCFFLGDLDRDLKVAIRPRKAQLPRQRAPAGPRERWLSSTDGDASGPEPKPGQVEVLTRWNRRQARLEEQVTAKGLVTLEKARGGVVRSAHEE